MNFQTMSKQRKLILIAAAVGVISMFLPWVSVLGFSVNGMHGSGILVFLCFVAAGVLAYMGDQTTNLPQTAWMMALIAGGIAALIMVINFFDASGSGLLSVGFYGALLASIGVIVAAFLFRSASDSLQGGFDRLKSSLGSRMNEGPVGSATATPTTTITPVSHTATEDTPRPMS